MFRLVVSSFIIFFLMGPLSSNALADYVLPYPSYMPGNKLYMISRFIDGVKKFWHWGTIGSLKYHMAMSDTYLVEAKTLFEYKQYMLALDALSRSDQHFSDIGYYIQKLKEEKKDSSLIMKSLEDQRLVHEKVLTHLSESLPSEYLWEPEKKKSENLDFKGILSESLAIRKR